MGFSPPFQQLLLKKCITTQLLSLINNVPKPEVNVKIEFVTDPDKFKQAVKSNFGTFKRTEDREAGGEVNHKIFICRKICLLKTGLVYLA